LRDPNIALGPPSVPDVRKYFPRKRHSKTTGISSSKAGMNTVSSQARAGIRRASRVTPLRNSVVEIPKKGDCKAIIQAMTEKTKKGGYFTKKAEAMSIA
jgi:hypothetical protein